VNIIINNAPLVQYTDFKYPGSTVSNNVRLEKELSYKIGIASATFGKLQDRLSGNRVQSVQTALLYEAEIWMVYCT